MNHSITLQIDKKSQVKTKLNQFKKLINFNEDTHVLNIRIQGGVFLERLSYYYLNQENIVIKDNELIVEMYNDKIEKLKNNCFLELFTYEK